jgi:hypothetical protein
MSLPKSIHKYEDIAKHLYTIIETDTRRREFPTPAEAQHWRMRAYMYRSLLEKEQNGSTLFTPLIFCITRAEPNVVTIRTEYEDNGWFVDAEGNRIESVPTPQEAKWAAEVAELRQKLDRLDLPDIEPQTDRNALSDLNLNLD